ncbi:MAG: Hsp20/alpha crystallin family protein [Isosphaeraceae bacterium]
MTRIPQWTWRRDLNTPLAALEKEFTKLYDQYRSKLTGGEATWVPDVDLFESDAELLVRIDLPGVDANSIDLSVSGRTLILRGNRPAPEANVGRARAQERYFGPFGRDVDLAEEVDPEGIRAEFQNGVLSVRLPKAARARTVTIPVRTA